MSIISKLVSFYITSALYHIGISKVMPSLQGSSLDLVQQTEYDAEMEVISLASSTATLVIDNLVNKHLFPDNKVMQHILTAIETLGVTSLIAKGCQSEPFTNVLSSTASKDFLDKNSFYVLGSVLLRNVVLKQVWDNNVDIDSIGDLKQIIDVDQASEVARVVF
jgi:hypothetical protein